MTEEPKSAGSEFQIAIVGPLTSAVIGGVCLGVVAILGPGLRNSPGAEVLLWLGYINLALAAFNLLPGYPMDGGRVLRAAFWWKQKDLLRATRYVVRVSNGVAAGFILIGILLFFRGAGIGGLWLAFIGWFLLQASRESYLQEELRRSMEGVKVADLMVRDLPLVDQNLSLQRFVSEQLLHSTSRYFFVTHGDEPVGIVTPKEITGIEQRMWPFTEVGTIMRPIDSLPSLAPDAPVMDALELMRGEESSPVPIVADGRLLGVLSRRTIMEYLQTVLELRRASRKEQPRFGSR